MYFDRGIAGGLSSTTGSMQLYSRIHIPLLGALTAVGAGVNMLIAESADGDVEAGAGWALAGGAALYLFCLTIAQSRTDRPPALETQRLRASALVLLVLLAAIAPLLAPVAFIALATAVLVALILLDARQRGT